MVNNVDYEDIHQYSRNNREALLVAVSCGCFYCKEIYKPDAITEWCDGGYTAICPTCEVDAILPESDKYLLDWELLNGMYDHWFVFNGRGHPRRLTRALKKQISDHIKNNITSSEKAVSLQMYLFMLSYTDIIQEPITITGLVKLFDELKLPLPQSLKYINESTFSEDT